MSALEPDETGLHATAAILGEDGVLILGASGAGKSALALALLARARATNAFAALSATTGSGCAGPPPG